MDWLRENFQWLKDDGPDKGQKFLQGMQVGSAIAERRRTADLQQRKFIADQDMAEKEYYLKKESLDYRNRLMEHDQQVKRQKAEGLTAIGDVMSRWTGKYDNPQAESDFWDVARRYPATMDDASFNNIANVFQRARDYSNRVKTPPAAVKNAQFVTDAETEAAKLEAAGDVEGAARKRQEAELVKQSIQSGNESTTISHDANGKPVVTITRGGSAGKTMGGVTVGTQSKLEQDLINSRKSLDMIGDLSQNLSWKDVGVAGVFGENVLDKTLPQLGIQSFDAKRTDNRTKLKMLVQGLLRQISPDNRFTNEDRERVEAIAPSSGVFENEAHAKQVLSVMQRVFAKRNVRDMQAMGKPIALDGLNDAEIGAAVEMGLIPFDEAKAFLIQKFKGK